MFGDEYYADLDRRTRAVLASCSQWLSESQVTLISEFIDSNEFGIAVEFLIDELVACGALIDSETKRRVVRLASLMNIDSEYSEAASELPIGVIDE